MDSNKPFRVAIVEADIEHEVLDSRPSEDAAMTMYVQNSSQPEPRYSDGAECGCDSRTHGQSYRFICEQFKGDPRRAVANGCECHCHDEQETIDLALEGWSNVDRGVVSLPKEQATPKQLATMHRLNDPRELAKLLREELIRRGNEAREPGDKVPGKDGEFITVGPIDGVDGDLIEIDRPDQCETFTMAQARKLLANLRAWMDVDLALRGGK